MDKSYSASNEDKIYSLWEKSGAFTPKIDKNKTPFSIILPLPNANNPMHMGHALFTVQDILIRYHRMLGDPSLWLPGGDHAGIETQFVFEKKLQKEGKSRFNYDRQTLYQMIWDFVEQNRKLNQFQMKKLGFSMDWTRYHYSLEPQILDNVNATFKKLYDDGLIYRDEKIVNYCTHCGTAFSNLEVVHKTVNSHLWYFKYPVVGEKTTIFFRNILIRFTVVIKNADKFQIEFFTQIIIFRRMGRCNFDGTSAELDINRFIKNNRNFAIDQRQ